MNREGGEERDGGKLLDKGKGIYRKSIILLNFSDIRHREGQSQDSFSWGTMTAFFTLQIKPI